MTHYRVVLTTASKMDEAKKIAREILSARLAACVNIVPDITSMYIWEDELVEEGECMLIIKTVGHNLDRLEKLIKKLHSYDIPEFLSIRIEEGGEDYLEWIEKVVKN